MKYGIASPDAMIHARYTPARHQWLRTLADAPGTNRRRGQVGFQCMRLGWTEWVYVPSPLAWWRINGEKLTEAGWIQLWEWERLYSPACMNRQ